MQIRTFAGPYLLIDRTFGARPIDNQHSRTGAVESKLAAAPNLRNYQFNYTAGTGQGIVVSRKEEEDPESENIWLRSVLAFCTRHDPVRGPMHSVKFCTTIHEIGQSLKSNLNLLLFHKFMNHLTLITGQGALIITCLAVDPKISLPTADFFRMPITIPSI